MEVLVLRILVVGVRVIGEVWCGLTSSIIENCKRSNVFQRMSGRVDVGKSRRGGSVVYARKRRSQRYRGEGGNYQVWRWVGVCWRYGVKASCLLRLICQQ